MECSENFLKKKIIVIGAGVSGLACATHLRQYGFENVLILEAKNRTGGRTYTVSQAIEQASETKEYFIEFGAEWIHGVEGNVVYEIAHSNGLIDESAYDYFEALQHCNLLNEKEVIAYKSLLEHLTEKFEIALEDLNEIINVSDLLDKIFTEYLEEFEDQSLAEFLKSCLDWYKKVQCELNGCTSLSHLSANLLNEYKECDGLKNVQLKFGFSSVLNLLNEKIPNGIILMNHVVEKIDWTDFKTQACNYNVETSAQKCKENTDLKVKVFCNNGKIFEADHVVITIPLGSLKKQVNILFAPALSENKIRAIQSVGFGTINKIFLQFKDPFWEPPVIYQVIWKDTFDEIFQGSDENSKTWVKDINRFAYTPGHRHMLCAWVVGEGAIIMENLSSEEVSSNCMELLEKITGRHLPMPSRIIRSKWHSDPETHGSYSYLSVDCDKESILQVANPEISDIICAQHPVLQFAGEATHSFHYSTVHGAYETGIREAERINEHYRYSQKHTV